MFVLLYLGSTEIILIFTTQLFISVLISYNSLYLDKREVLQQEYSQHPILPSPHFRWVLNDCTIFFHLSYLT